MFTMIWTRIAAWYATSNASHLFIIVIAGLLFAGYWYADSCSDCKRDAIAAQQAQDRYNALAEKYAREVNKDRDAQIENIENGNHPCLDVELGELLDNPDQSDQVRGTGTGKAD